jgi:hypothetical protein
MSNNQQKVRENYFSINIARFGDNFVAQRSAQDIQKDAKRRIFKDMVYGNIDYDLYGKYFTDINFIENLITVATIESEKHTVEYQALYMFDMSYPGNSIVNLLTRQHANVAFVLGQILQVLQMVKYDNMNIRYLTDLAVNCANFRKDFGEFY